MQNGIYKVTFSSNSGSLGEGLIAFSNGAVNGGDDGFLYQGKLTLADGNVAGSLNVKQYNAHKISVFAPLTNFVLDLTGTSDSSSGSFQASGFIKNNPGATINISGKLISSLVE